MNVRPLHGEGTMHDGASARLSSYQRIPSVWTVVNLQRCLITVHARGVNCSRLASKTLMLISTCKLGVPHVTAGRRLSTTVGLVHAGEGGRKSLSTCI